MSLFSIFAENSYSVCLAAALVAPLFVRNLYETAAGLDWLLSNLCIEPLDRMLIFAGVYHSEQTITSLSSDVGRGGRKPSPNSVKLNPIMSREKRLTSES